MGGIMDEKLMIRALSSRLTEVRAAILKEQPFFGRLILRLNNRFAKCGTACTDMQCIAFDPDFAGRLGNEELRFVYLHELMHCVLHHCTRGKGKIQYIYNVACDIVVNSMLLETMYLTDFAVDGVKVMHLAPNGMEGRGYSAEELYDMLIKTPPEDLSRLYGQHMVDDHSIWARLKSGSVLDDQWDKNIRDAAKNAGTGSGIPAGLRRHLKVASHNPTTNWRQLLHDYIQYDRSDYTYSIPDRRFSEDIIMPSFQENMYGGRLDQLWILIDTSGSVSDEAVTVAFYEIKDAAQQMGNLAGMVSFFDCEVSEPTPFETAEDLMDVKPVGGGGTSFRRIFRYMRENMEDELPKLTLTDGCAPFPKEEDSLGVDVIWVIIDSDVEPPWGSCVHIDL